MYRLNRCQDVKDMLGKGGDKLLGFYKRLFSKKTDIPKPIASQNMRSSINHLVPRRFRTYSVDAQKQQQLRVLSRNGIIRRGVEKIKRGILSLEYELVPTGKIDRRFKQNSEIVKNFIEHPNIVHDYHSLFDMILEDLIVLDAGTFNKRLGGDIKRPVFLYPVDAITIEKLEPYDYTNPDGDMYVQSFGVTSEKRFSSKDISYWQMNHFTDNPYGLSNVEKVWRYLNYFMDALDNAADVASIDYPKYLINFKNGETNKVKEFREYMVNEIQGTGNVPIVGGEVNGVQIGAINSDSLFLEWQKFLLTLVAKCFDLPESFFIANEVSDRNTISETEQQILINAIKPYANVMQRGINQIIVESGIDNVQFAFKYQQTDEQRKIKEETIRNKYKDGLVSQNEARVELGYELSTNKYADFNVFEAKASMNKDYYVQSGGFNGQGSIKETSGGDKNG